ncbi:MAG: ferrochelatase [Alphaproteobacteria bacterium]|jgi:ferrochelatase
MNYKTEPTHDHKRRTNNTGVLIMNLGTPSALDYFSLRRYLKEFLSDPRVVEGNRIKWWLVLNIILLSFIPFRSAKNYKKIWNTDKNESPLLTFTRSQGEKLQKAYEGEDVIVEYAMRYGTPSIEQKINALKAKGCKKILLFPLYPQYSAVTTASTFDASFAALKKLRWMPAIKTAKPYYNNKAYTNALCASIKKHMKDEGKNFNTTTLVFSYHGIPQKYFQSGDPYPCHCVKTTALIKETLKLSDDTIQTAYQSRFGREEWVKPYLDATLKEMPQKGVKDIIIISPAFASDCVETLEELSMESKETFLEAGGKSFSVVPCLNDSDIGINMLKSVIDEELQGF